MEQTSSQCSKSRWEMELHADDEMCQSYVVGKRVSVEGMQETHEVFKSK